MNKAMIENLLQKPKAGQAKKGKAKNKKLPAGQGDYKVGNKKPPKEHQFQPGQSGNPNGPPIRRVNLWPLFCNFMGMTDVELEKLDRKELTQAQQTALTLVKDMKAGKYSGSQRLARHVFDRDEGRPLERVRIEPTDILSDAECEEIRKILKSYVK